MYTKEEIKSQIRKISKVGKIIRKNDLTSSYYYLIMNTYA